MLIIYLNGLIVYLLVRKNRFTKQDIKAGLQAYKEPTVNYPRDTIAKLSGIEIKENKRNYRNRAEHIKVKECYETSEKELGERINEGRPKGSGNES